MTWIQTASGRKFRYDSLDASEVSLEDIAVALSRTPRFAGHTSEFYSVAQHSVIVAFLVERAGGTPQEQLLGLLHDATEAYLSDVPKPAKRMLPDYCELESRVWDKICLRFLGATTKLPRIVKDADAAALAAEARDLFDFAPLDDWVATLPRPPDMRIVPASMEKSEAIFLSEYARIRRQINYAHV